MNRRDFHRTMVIDGKALNYRFLGCAQLNNYELAFNAYSRVRQGGVLDIVKCNGKQVIGVLYELSGEALKRVDIREGSLYERILVEVSIENKKLQAYTYAVKNKLSTKANYEYSKIVYNAMLQNGFPKVYVDEFVESVRVAIYGTEGNGYNKK